MKRILLYQDVRIHINNMANFDPLLQDSIYNSVSFTASARYYQAILFLMFVLL